MPREARVVVPNCPHHIVQRGHNRQPVFLAEEDYRYYLNNLSEWKRQLGCRVYAFCLMTNHIHLVVDPGEKVENLALLIKRVAGRQTRYMNRLEARTGSLWEGRYKSSPIDANDYLLSCCRYVELNPVRAGMVTEPWEYEWSSCRVKAGLEKNDWLDLEDFYLSFGGGENQVSREQAYQAWLLGSIEDEELKMIRSALQRNQLTGTDLFRDKIAERLGRRVENRGRGRPKK